MGYNVKLTSILSHLVCFGYASFGKPSISAWCAPFLNRDSADSSTPRHTQHPAGIFVIILFPTAKTVGRTWVCRAVQLNKTIICLNKYICCLILIGYWHREVISNRKETSCFPLVRPGFEPAPSTHSPEDWIIYTRYALFSVLLRFGIRRSISFWVTS